MNRRNKKKSNKQVKRNQCSFILSDHMIEIQAEAYYRALKKMEQEKMEQEKMESQVLVGNKKKKKWYANVLFALNIIFFPWKINKHFNINNQIYDSILVFFVSGGLQMIGGVIWLVGIFAIIYDIYKVIVHGAFDTIFPILFIAFLMLLIGSIFTLSGDKFSQETDSNKIYAYSASIIALISCAVSIISFLLRI